jgi:peptide/nickel transport system substrate-binding protein
MRLAFRSMIYPEHIHAKLVNKAEFGASPVGTGPYRIVKLDKNAGIIAERNPTYVASEVKPVAKISKVVAEPIPDSGTMIAALLTGKADVAEDIPADQAADLLATGRFQVSLEPSFLSLNFISFPTPGWEQVKALGDPRVRLAIIKAIDRPALIQAMLGDLSAGVKPVEALCDKTQLGCGYTKTTPDYDPAGAQKLLAEAGYADGFDVTISCFRLPVAVVVTTAITGMLRKVGIRATVQSHTLEQRVPLHRDGKVQIGYYGWSGGGTFDMAPQIERHFSGLEYKDDALTAVAAATNSILDDTQRRTAVAKVLDYATENAYAFALIPTKATFTHSKDVMLDITGKREEVYVNDFRWR